MGNLTSDDVVRTVHGEDRELLELAAKAAGMNIEERWFWQQIHDTEWGLYAHNANGTMKGWNPLTDDGDALRLVVKLKLDVELSIGRDTNDILAVDYWDECRQQYMSEMEPTGTDPYAATRRAIVRAAAAIAKATP